MVLICHHCILALRVWARRSPFRVTFAHRSLQVRAALFSAAYTQHLLCSLTLSTDESNFQTGPEPEPLNPERLPTFALSGHM